MKSKTVLSIACSVLILASCTVEEPPSLKEAELDLPATPYAYGMGNNDHLPTLGRVLFYDQRLSINSSVSCASCHKQNLAFADNVAFSKGFDNRFTDRNSMPIQNIRGGFVMIDSIGIGPSFGDPNLSFGTFTTLFWDGREHNLKSMVLRPIFNEVEMGVKDLNELNRKLINIPYYQELFQKAYGTNEITSEKIATALSSFLMSITSRNTKFDQSFIFKSTLTPLETAGKTLFSSVYDCNSCHQVQNPQGYIQAGTFANIGLKESYEDNGLGEVTKKESDNGKFKIPSLRNIALTAPYMHDGRFATLEEVIDHYSDGLADHPNLDHRLRNVNGQPMRMDIPESDKKSIIAFLKTLTDEQMISDPKFSNPFKINQ